MLSVRRVTVAVVGLLAAAFLVPASAQGSAAPPPSRGHYVVGFHSVPSGLSKGDTFQGAEVERVDRVLRYARVETQDAGAFLARARGQASVRYVEADPLRKLIEFTPNDPRFATQQYGPQHVRAPEAWDTTLGDLDAKVCVVDTGVRYTHEEIAGPRWLGGHDFINNDNDPNDDHGHGTHVAGTAAGGLNNAKGIAGLGNTGIYGVKVLDSGGFGSWSAVAAGIRWCADNGGPRTVINMSLGDLFTQQVLTDAVVYANNQGALLVAAAGNDGPCSNCVSYPAKYPEVIAVTCTTSAKTQCGFSSDGPESDLTAPGNAIVSSVNTTDTSYASFSGTSMSTPHVAGVAALVWSEETGLTNTSLRQRLEDNAQDLGAPGWDQLYGWGLVDAAATLDPPTQPPLLFEDFDDGVANGWTRTGLWRVSSLCPPTPPSTPNYLGYHQSGACNFNTGARTTGTATFDVDLTGQSSATLNFMHRFEKENFQTTPRDIMRVQVGGFGAGTITLQQWDSRDPDQLAWTNHSIDLSPYVGQAVKVRFFFDSVNSTANDFDGWFLDNVEVTSGVPAPNEPPVANAGPNQTVTDTDDSGSEPVTLDGTGSFDSDGSIVSYEWTEGGNPIASGPTPTVNFSVGTHNVTLTVTDNDTETDTDNVVITVNPPPPPGETLAFENFDDGVANGWTRTGLWRVSSLCPPTPPSTPNYLGYHQSGACNFNTGARTTGTATFDVDLTGQSSATLNFMHRFEKENFQTTPRDIMRVQVGGFGAGTITLQQWDSRDPDQLAWTNHSIDLSPYVGQAVKVRFFFDSVNGTANDFDGWFLDNVQVTGS